MALRDLRWRSRLQRHQRKTAKSAAADVASTVNRTKGGKAGSLVGSVKVTLVKDSLPRLFKIRNYRIDHCAVLEASYQV